MLVLIGMLLAQRADAKEMLARTPLERGEDIVRLAIKQQGVILGIDKAIGLIFDLANFEPELETNNAEVA